MGHNLILSVLLFGSFLLKGGRAQVCGNAPLNPVIVGGADAAPGSWPWQVFLAIPGIDGTYQCGGALINRQWILTAAHCLHDSFGILTTVNMGLNQADPNDPNLVQRTVIQVEIHSKYNPMTLENDIALLRMASPVTFNNYIQPVCLAQRGSTFYTGVEAWVAGWGTTSEGGSTSKVLQEVSLPIVGDKECKCNNTLLSPPQKTICAGFAKGGKDTCQGDSGGPLVVKSGTVWIQTGIVSFGEGCARPNIPGVYTEVSEFQDWINDIVGSGDRPGYVKYTSTGVDRDKDYTCGGAAATAATAFVTVLCLSLTTFSLW